MGLSPDWANPGTLSSEKEIYDALTACNPPIALISGPSGTGKNINIRIYCRILLLPEQFNHRGICIKQSVRCNHRKLCQSWNGGSVSPVHGTL